MDDPTIGPVVRAKEAGEKPDPDQVKAMSLHGRRLLQLWDQLMLKAQLLWRQYENPRGSLTTLQLVVPPSRREEVLRDMHEGVLGGHLGQEKTLERVKERYY